ncbi:MAG: hypothetical protein ACJAXA_002612 [Candidatus Aldehydirespiratoraceae bacterium]|jgi:hypothetical protein
MRTVEWIDNAAAAFEAALAELIGERSPDLDPAEAGRRAALKAVAGTLWTDAVGHFYDTEGVMSLLGGVSKQAVHDRVRRHRLLALRTGSGRLVYPTAQFDEDRVVDGLGAALTLLAPDHTEAWMVASWLTTADPALNGTTPLDARRSTFRPERRRHGCSPTGRCHASRVTRMVDFAEPPASGLDRFPVRTLAAGTSLHRLHHRSLGPCWFSSFESGNHRAERFDLTPHRGSSYWALQPEAAFLETIARRPVTIVPVGIIDRYALTSVNLPADRACANAPVKRARSFGLTAEFHATSDYSITRRWAAALDAAGHTSLTSIPRHDVTAKLRSITLFGRSGERRPPLWKKTLKTRPIPTATIDAMSAWGIRCLPIPFDVQTISPPPS